MVGKFETTYKKALQLTGYYYSSGGPQCGTTEIVLSGGRDTVTLYECRMKVPGIPTNIIAYENTLDAGTFHSMDFHGMLVKSIDRRDSCEH